MKLKIKNYKGGYALLETVFYIVLFAILSIAVINSMVVMTKAFRETSIQAELITGGKILERISREIRQANGIASISIDSLKLNSKDNVGNNKTIQFSLSGTDINLLENDVSIGNLNTSNIKITNLSFNQINTTKGIAIKVFLSVISNNDPLSREESFYNTVVLRGSY